jgi:isochorismate synthase
MSKPGLEEVFSQLLSAEQAFVFYRLPNDKTVHCHHQEDAPLTYTTDLKIKGFVMSRFDTPLPAVYISDKNHLQFDYNPPNFMGKEVEPYIDLEKKTSFINVVNETKKAIASGHLKKLVVARKITQKREVDALKLFTHLLRLYPRAMVYFWHHPKGETWIGASPEQLFSLQSGRLTTMALAGTLPYNSKEEYHWGEKEKTEQGWVRDTLHADLEALFPSQVIQCSETFTRRAGNLVHLCNELSVEAQNINTTALLKKLHPTPAVGGIPVEEGMRFLAKHENLDRAYYTGFLGPVMGEDQMDVFVNLRCAQMIPKALVLYVGAGITQDSDPEKEWVETQNKSKTLLAAL